MLPGNVTSVIMLAGLLMTSLYWSGNARACDEDSWGHLTGQIRVVGKRPQIPREAIDRDQPTCLADREPPLDDNIVIDSAGGLRDAFVMMYLKGGETPPVHASYEEARHKVVELDNLLCRFEPHALFVRTGQTLRLKNSDDVGHNCHIVLLNSEENVNIPVHDHVDVKFSEPEKVPGNVVCDIHRWMDAVLLVRDEPYAAISDSDGRFVIKNIPIGEWSFQFWHKKMGYMRELQVPQNEIGRRGEMSVRIDAGKTLDLGVLQIDGKYFKD